MNAIQIGHGPSVADDLRLARGLEARADGLKLRRTDKVQELLDVADDIDEQKRKIDQLLLNKRDSLQSTKEMVDRLKAIEMALNNGQDKEQSDSSLVECAKTLVARVLGSVKEGEHHDEYDIYGLASQRERIRNTFSPDRLTPSQADDHGSSSTAQSEVNRLRTELARSQAKVAELTSSNQNLAERNKVLAGQNERRQSLIEKLQDTRTDLEADIIKLENRVSEMEVKSKVDAAQATGAGETENKRTPEELEARIQSLETELHDIEESGRHTDQTLQQTLTTEQLAMAELRIKIATVEEREKVIVDALRAEQYTSKSLEGEIQRCELRHSSAVEAIEDSMSKLRDELREQEARKDRAEHDLENFASLMLCNDLNWLKTELSDLFASSLTEPPQPLGFLPPLIGDGTVENWSLGHAMLLTVGSTSNLDHLATVVKAASSFNEPILRWVLERFVESLTGFLFGGDLDLENEAAVFQTLYVVGRMWSFCQVDLSEYSRRAYMEALTIPTLPFPEPSEIIRGGTLTRVDVPSGFSGAFMASEHRIRLVVDAEGDISTGLALLVENLRGVRLASDFDSHGLYPTILARLLHYLNTEPALFNFMGFWKRGRSGKWLCIDEVVNLGSRSWHFLTPAAERIRVRCDRHPQSCLVVRIIKVDGERRLDMVVY